MRIRMMTVRRVEANSVIPVTEISNALFCCTDPTNVFSFSTNSFTTSLSDDVLIIEFDTLVNLVVGEYLENGYHVSYNNTDPNQPTHTYDFFPFVSFENEQFTILISSGISTDTSSIDFIYKSIPFAYKDYVPLLKEARLVYDLDVEFPSSSRANTFTFVLKYTSTRVQEIQLALFSNHELTFELRPTADVADFVLEYDGVAKTLSSLDVHHEFSIPYVPSSGIVELRSVRRTLGAEMRVHNLIVLPGKFITSRIDSNSQNNIFIGNKSGYRNRTGITNVFIGNESGGANLSGANNIFFGNRCGADSTAGNRNVCIGTEAGLYVAGDDNIFIGPQSGAQTTVGARNVFIGNKCGSRNVNGVENICVGNDIRSIGSHNIFITNELSTEMETDSHRLQIGNLITGRMDDPSVSVHGLLYVNDTLIHYKTKHVRFYLHSLPSAIEYTHVIIDTGSEKIDALQRVADATESIILDCRASMVHPIVTLRVRTSAGDVLTEVPLSNDEARLDAFDVQFLSDRVDITHSSVV